MRAGFLEEAVIGLSFEDIKVLIRQRQRGECSGQREQHAQRIGVGGALG